MFVVVLYDTNMGVEEAFYPLRWLQKTLKL